MKLSQEKDLKKLEKIIDDQLNKDKLEEYNKTIPIFVIVKKFISSKKLILYGGLAINNLLPKKNRFYDKYTIPDYDCFSPNAKQDAMELAKLLHQNKYPYIEVKPAQHDGTYKVYVDFLGVADITDINKNFYKRLIPHCIKSHDSSLYFIPPEYIKYGLYLELARPEGSLYRWEKVYGRSLLFLKAFPDKLQNSKKMLPIIEKFDDIEHKLITILKKFNNPIIGSFAIHVLTKNENSNINTIFSRLQILSQEPDETMKQLIQELDIDTKMYEIQQSKSYYVGILSYTKTLIIYDKYNKKKCNLLSITETGHYCYSVIKFNGFLFGTGFTIITFLFAYLLEYKITDNKLLYDDTLSLINLISAWNNNRKDIHDRFITDCYGKEKTINDIRKERWIANKSKFRGWRPGFTI